VRARACVCARKQKRQQTGPTIGRNKVNASRKRAYVCNRLERLEGDANLRDAGRRPHGHLHAVKGVGVVRRVRSHLRGRGTVKRWRQARLQWRESETRREGHLADAKEGGGLVVCDKAEVVPARLGRRPAQEDGRPAAVCVVVVVVVVVVRDAAKLRAKLATLACWLKLASALVPETCSRCRLGRWRFSARNAPAPRRFEPHICTHSKHTHSCRSIHQLYRKPTFPSHTYFGCSGAAPVRKTET